MSTSKRGLGRGLEALLPPGVPAALAPGIREIDVASIVPNPRQPRHKEDSTALSDLADSIKEYGLIQPLIVTLAPEATPAEPRYQLIAGERRWKAAKLAGLERVPVIVRGATPQEMLELALVENIQREDLNPLEEASAYKQLMDDFGLTQEQVAAKVGKDRATIANALRLLKLPEEIQAALAEQAITEGHARALLTVIHPRHQKALLRMVISDGYSVRQTEETARRANESLHEGHPAGSKVVARAEQKSPITLALEERLRRVLGTKVEVFRSRKGGKIVLHFYSEEELHSIYEKIVGKR